MFRKYFAVGGLLLFTLFIIGTGNFAQRGSDPKATPNRIPELPPGFRGINPPLEITANFDASVTSAPLPTTTPFVTASGAIDTSRSVGTTYAVIPAGDEAMLLDAFEQAAIFDNTQPGVAYKIYLAAGEYLLEETLVGFGTIEIYGAGIDVTILRQIGLPGPQFGSMNTMIKVPENKSLKLDNITLADGRSGESGGAISVEGWNSTLSISNAKFINNQANDSVGGGDGGAIFSRGRVTLSKVYFTGNTAKRGGAVFNLSPITDFAVTANNVDFHNNISTHSGGGAIYNEQKPNGTIGTLKIRQSNFRANTSINSAGVRAHVFSARTDIVTINAKKNYWNNPTVSASANVQGVNTLELLTAKVNFTPDPPQAPPVDPCGLRQCTVPTSTPTATSSPTPGTSINSIIQDLATYGITVYAGGVGSNRTNGQAWTLVELQEVQEAVRDVARAFSLLRYNQDSGTSTVARNLFRNVMKQTATGANLEILRVTNSFQFGNNDPCDAGTADEGCTSNGNTAIALYGDFALGGITNANYTIVHEIGHRFDNQSGTNNVEGLSGRMDDGTVITDCTNYVPNTSYGLRVMGTLFSDPQPNDWKRGSRGWGTHGSSIFQQNILEIVDSSVSPPNTTDETLEVGEAAADMFLNWVYRRLTDGPIQPDGPNEDKRCSTHNEIGIWSGFRNIKADGTFDSTLPGNARYWWMEEQLGLIFSEQGTWD